MIDTKLRKLKPQVLINELENLRKIFIEFPEPKQVLSFSGISAWKRCRQIYWYSRVLKLKKKTKPLPLVKGSAVHAMIEAWLKGEDWHKALKIIRKDYDKLMDEEKLLYGDLPTECERLMEGYIECWKSFKCETLAVEVAFGMEGIIPLEIVPGVFLKGRIDWILRDNHGIWVADHKTVKRGLPDESYRLQDLQTIIYMKALPLLGFPKPVGAMYDYILTKTPTVPKPLKNGELSKSMKVGTDYTTFMRAIKDNNLKAKDYTAQLELAKLNKFYSRKYIAKPQKLAERLLCDLEIINWEIDHLKDKPYRNLGRDCSWCQYQTLCTAEMMGLDTTYMLKTEFEIDTHNDEVVEPNEDEEEND